MSSSIDLNFKFECELIPEERRYIRKCYYEKTGGRIPDPWMEYPKHSDWDTKVNRLKTLNTPGYIWADGEYHLTQNDKTWKDYG